MARVTRLTLDVLKPHHPDTLEFSLQLSSAAGNARVTVTVLEMDEQTETVQVTVEGETIDFPRVKEAILGAGASLHSIDEVEVVGTEDGGA